MRRLLIVPDGWPCRFEECRPGYFIWEGNLCLKSEYGGEAYNEAGEIFWGGVSDPKQRAALTVQAVDPVWEEFEP